MRGIDLIDKIISINGKAPRAFTRFIKYCLVGAITSFLEVLLLFILVHYISIYYLIATTLAFVSSDSLAFALNFKWGFKESKTGTLRGYVFFLSFSFMALITTLLFMKIFVDVIGIYYILSRIVILIFMGIVKFTLHYVITFKLHHRDEFRINYQS